MTTEEILKLAETCGFDDIMGEKPDETFGIYWECWEEQLLKFARSMYEEGYDQGCFEATGGQ